MRSVEWFCVTSKKPLKCATPFLPLTLKPSSFFLLQQSNDVWLWQCGWTQCAKGEEWGVLRNGQKAGGLSLRVKRDERVVGLVVGWVDVSVMAWCQTLCHCQCQATSTHPSMVSHSPVCFKAIVFVATPISVFVLLCCPTFALCPIPFSLAIVVSLLLVS